MHVRAITWNLFHGRDAPPNPKLFTWRSRLLKISERDDRYLQVNRDLSDEFSATLDTLDWDLALLQETPPRWAARLAEVCSADGHLVLTSRNRLPRLSALIADFNPDLIASSEGGSNLTLVRGKLLRGSGISERRELVVREGRPERRAMVFSRTSSGLCIANLHTSSNRPDLATAEVRRAAATATAWASGAPLIFGGDLNLRPREQPEQFAELREQHGLASPTGPHSIDHLLASGLATIEAPHPLPPEARELVDSRSGLRIRLSDHAPVSAAFELPAS